MLGLLSKSRQRKDVTVFLANIMANVIVSTNWGLRDHKHKPAVLIILNQAMFERKKSVLLWVHLVLYTKLKLNLSQTQQLVMNVLHRLMLSLAELLQPPAVLFYNTLRENC